MRNIRIAAFVYLLFFVFACGDKTSENNTVSDTLSEEQRHLPQNSLKGLIVADGLEVKMMSCEPVLRNATNLDVDDSGRIWVTEAFNYRPFRNSTVSPDGDRIIILEDKDGDGLAETHKVF